MKSQLTAGLLMFAALVLGVVLTASLAGCRARTVSKPSNTTLSSPTVDEADDRVPSEPSEPTMSSEPAALTEQPEPTTTPETTEGRVPSEPMEPTISSKPASLDENAKPVEKPAPAESNPAEPKPSATVQPPVPDAKPPAPEVNTADEEPASNGDPQEDPANGQETADAEVKSVGLNLLAAVDKKANAPVKEGDWNQWAGTSYRNNTPITSSLPESFDIGGFDRKTGEWKKDQAENIKWVTSLGSQTYGNPVVAGGQVYVGTNNGNGYLPRYSAEVDLGCLLAFKESDGTFLWQHSSEKLDTGRVHDWPLQGICCAPLVEGDRLWFVTSRGELRCLDTAGYYDGEDDGPVQNERARLFNVEGASELYKPAIAALDAGNVTDEVRAEFARVEMPLPDDIKVETVEAGKKWSLTAEVNGSQRQFQFMVAGPRLAVYKTVTPDDKHEADTIWVLDMMKELGVSQHNMCSCSVTSLGDILFVCTSNGLDESHINLPAPNAPSFMAVDKNSGDVYWTDKSPGTNILHGQWSSPAVAELGGVTQVIFAGGDSWLYSFRADKGKDGSPELLWKFDCNPKETKYILGGRGTRNELIATPTVYDGLVYIAVGQDPEHGEGGGHLWCLDPTKRGDISAELAMKVEGDKRVPIAHRRLQAVIPEEGEVAVPNPNSGVVWHYSHFDQNGDGQIDFEEEMHRTIGTVAIKDDLLFVADFSGLFHCLDAKGDGQGNAKVYWTYDMLAASWGSPLIADGRVFIGDEDGDLSIFPLSKEKQEEPLFEINMGSSVYSTPIVANGTIFISTKDKLFAIAEPTEAAE